MNFLFSIDFICFSPKLLVLQYSGPSKDALAYVEWVREDPRFSDILVQISPASNGHAFPRLKLRYKPSLVQASFIDPLYFVLMLAVKFIDFA